MRLGSRDMKSIMPVNRRKLKKKKKLKKKILKVKKLKINKLCKKKKMKVRSKAKKTKMKKKMKINHKSRNRPKTLTLLRMFRMPKIKKNKSKNLNPMFSKYPLLPNLNSHR